MSKQPRLAIFDVDGTLIDSQHNIVAAMTMAFQAQGLAKPRASDVRSIIGLSLPEACEVLVPTSDSALQDAISRSYRDAFSILRARPGHTEPLYPGVREALTALEAGGWLFGHCHGQIAARFGIDDRTAWFSRAFYHPADRWTIIPGKPDPAMVLRALAESGVEASCAAMIGDTSFDVRMGRAAGVHAVGVAWGYHSQEDLLKAGAEAVVHEFSSLPAALAGLMEAEKCDYPSC